MSYQYHSAELDSVLKALGSATSQLQSGNQAQSAPSHEPQVGPQSLVTKQGIPSDASDPRQDDYDPASFVPVQVPERIAAVTEPVVSALDPRTITTWKPALRHVTRLVSREHAVQERVRKMYKTQRDHEKQWWQGREAMLKQQAVRGEGRKKLGELLKNVGGSVNVAIGGPTPEEDAVELQRYDAKVYHAFSEMQKDYRNQLATMGIPFFNTRPSLIVNDETSSGHNTSVDAGRQGESTESVTKSELKALQKRMVELLEDLCAD